MIFDRLFDFMDIGEDITKNASVITSIGRSSVTIENYKSIRTYTEEEIIVLMQKYSLSVKGKKLYLKQLSETEIIIAGFIEQLLYKR